MSSIYDPLGFTAPFTLPAKVLLQELCKSGLQWNDVIKPNHLQRWNTWLQELSKLEQLRVPRCMKPQFWSETDGSSSQLHTFADASQSGYGAVSYLRFSDKEGNIHCSFVKILCGPFESDYRLTTRAVGCSYSIKTRHDGSEGDRYTN